MINGCLSIWPDPDQIIEPMVIDKSVSHNSVKLLGRLSPFGSPPEPKSVCLVKGSPKDRDVFSLESLKLSGNCIKVSNGSSVFFRTWSDCLGDIEVCLVGVENTSLERASKRWEPVPFKRDDTLFVWRVIPVDGFLDRAVIPRRPVIVPGVVRRIVLHVKCLDDGALAKELAELLVLTDLAAEDFILPVTEESVIQVYCRLRRVKSC